MVWKFIMWKNDCPPNEYLTMRQQYEKDTRMRDFISRIKHNKKIAVVYRTFRYINNDNYINKVYNINTLNINLGSIRKSGEIYYVIEIKDNTSGFFAHIYWVMNGLYIADRLGFIPYISIKGSKYNDSINPQDNMYEHYYIQKYELKKNVSYISYELSLSSYLWKEFDMNGYIVSEDYINAMAEILNKYMELQPEIKNRIFSDIKGLIKNPSRTLAVHARGTAYSVGFYGHPVQVKFKDYCIYIDEALKRGFEIIFLATDDDELRGKFQETYGEKVIFFNDVLRSSNSLDVIDLEDTRKDNAFRMGYEVLRDAIAMSCCYGFVAGFSKVSMYTRIQKKAKGEEFEYIKIIDKGIVEKRNFLSEQRYRMKKKSYDRKKG